MIPTAAASVAIQLVKGAIKMRHRIDLVLAEKEAVQAPLALPVPTLSLLPGMRVMVDGLDSLLEEMPGPLTDRQRKTVTAAVAAAKARKTDSKSDVIEQVRQHLPNLLHSKHLDLNSTFVKALKVARPDMAADPDLIVTAFYLGAGEDFREKSYTWRLALTAVDVIAEFGAENAALFTRDPRMQKVASSVLKRFGEADLQTADSTKDALKAALAATLNGALEVRGEINPDNKLLGGVLNALVGARSSMPENQRDDFFVGLLNGKGYPALVSSVLTTATGAFSDQDAEGFETVATGFLKQVAGIVKERPDFQDFFQDHWGDIVRAGLDTVSTNAPTLLGDQPLLGKVLMRVAGDLANHRDSMLLSTETLFGIVDSTAAVVAANPKLASQLLGTNKDWVDKLVVSVTKTVADDGIVKIFSQKGVESLFKESFTTFAAHPELLVGDSDLAGKLVKGVLKKLSDGDSFAARDLATAAIGGALTALADNPALVGLDYPDLVADLAGRMSQLAGDKKLTGIQARDLVGVGIATLTKNPDLFLNLKRDLGGKVLGAVIGAADGNPGILVAGSSLVRIGEAVATAFARTGKVAFTNGHLDDVEDQLGLLLEAGLTRAADELGKSLTLPDVPATLGLLVESWISEKVGVIDAQNPNFINLFSDLITRAAA